MINDFRNAAKNKEKVVLGNNECISLLKTLFKAQKKRLIESSEEYLRNAETRIANDTLDDEAKNFTASEMNFNRFKKDGDKEARVHIYKDISKEHYIEKIININNELSGDKKLSEAAIEWLKGQSPAVIYTIYFDMELSRPLDGIKNIDFSELYDKPLQLEKVSDIKDNGGKVRPVSEGATSILDRDTESTESKRVNPDNDDASYFLYEINEMKNAKLEQIGEFAKTVFGYVVEKSKINGLFEPDEEQAIFETILEITKVQLESRRYDIEIDQYYKEEDLYNESVTFTSTDGEMLDSEAIYGLFENYDGTIESLNVDKLVEQGITVEQESNEKESLDDFLECIILGNDVETALYDLGLEVTDVNNFFNMHFDNHKIDVENSVKMINIETILATLEDNVKTNIITNLIEEIILEKEDSEKYQNLINTLYKDEFGNDICFHDKLFNTLTIDEILFITKNYELIGAGNIFKILDSPYIDDLIDAIECMDALREYRDMDELRGDEDLRREYMELEKICRDFILSDEDKKKLSSAMCPPGRFYEIIPEQIDEALEQLNEFINQVEQ